MLKKILITFIVILIMFSFCEARGVVSPPVEQKPEFLNHLRVQFFVFHTTLSQDSFDNLTKVINRFISSHKTIKIKIHFNNGRPVSIEIWYVE